MVNKENYSMVFPLKSNMEIRQLSWKSVGSRWDFCFICFALF